LRKARGSRAPLAHASLCLLLASACSDPDPEPAPKLAFWPLDFETSYAKVRDCRLSPAEHDGYYIQVFANSAAEQAYVEGLYPFAPGSELVKGEYEDDACAVLARTSGMQKLEPGSDPELADWQWQRADRQGHLKTETPARSCAGCHEACESSDYTCTEP